MIQNNTEKASKRLKGQGFRKKKCGKKRDKIDEHKVQANEVSVISE